MRFLTFNLWHGLAPSTPVAFEALEPTARRLLREKMQLEILKQTPVDVSFFQEVNPLVARAPSVAQAAGADYVSQLDLVGLKLFGVGVPLNLNSGLMVTVNKRWGMKKVDAVSLSRPGMNLARRWASWQLREERFALFAETSFPKWGRVLLVNTHLHHGLESTPALLEKLDQMADELELSASMISELRDRIIKGNQRRGQELTTLMKTVESHSRRYGAVIMGGDFNASPDSEIGHILMEMGFRDVWEAANGQAPGLTLDAETNRANHLLQERFPLTLVVEDLSFSAKVKEALHALAWAQEKRPRRIDYLWMRGNGLDLKVTKAELIGHPNAEGLAPSDHYGLLADIEVG